MNTKTYQDTLIELAPNKDCEAKFKGKNCYAFRGAALPDNLAKNFHVVGDRLFLFPTGCEPFLAANLHRGYILIDQKA